MTESATFYQLTEKGVKRLEYSPGVTNLAAETDNFLLYIEENYPDLSRNQAAWVASYFISQYSILIERNEILKEHLAQVVEYSKTRTQEFS